MQIKNVTIFSSTNAADGVWQDISNLVAFSVQVVNLEGKVWIEVSNDPFVQTDGANAQLAAPAAPTVAQITPTQGGGLPAQALSLKVTYTTRNQPIVLPIPLYSTVVGETLPSAATAVSVTAGKVAIVVAPPADAAGIATGYNVYVQFGGVGPYYLQNYRGGSTNPRWDGPIPLGTPYALLNGFNQSGIVAPVVDTSGGPGVGVNIQGAAGNLVGATTTLDANPVLIADTNNGGEISLSTSSLTWKWLRVRKDATAQTKQTQAWITGQTG